VDTRSLIRNFIGETFFVEEFADEDSFLQKGVIDSTGMLELVAFIEERFAIKLDDAELVPQNLDSLDNLCHFLDTKQHKKT
jgi:acyl carrier protein